MKLISKWRELSIVVLGTLAAANLVTAQAQPAIAGGTVLEPILERIRAHASNQEWKKDGWKVQQIDDWLESLVRPIIKASELSALKIPVHSSDVRPADPGLQIENGMLVGKSMRLRTLRRSVVLCDGDFEAEHVEDSVVIARRCVFISPEANTPDAVSAERSVIVAGTYVFIMDSGKEGSDAGGNIVVSRGWADAGQASGSAFFAPEGMSVLIANDNAFINADLETSIQSRDRKQNRSVRIPDLAIGPVPRHPMSPKLEVIGVVAPTLPHPGPNRERIGLAFRYAGRRCVAMRGETIVDEAETPLPDFAGWKLRHLCDPLIAVFDTDSADGVVRIFRPSKEMKRPK